MLRSFIEFNTTSLQQGYILTGAKLRLYGSADNSTTDFIIKLQNWTGTTPIETADYNSFGSINYDNNDFSTSGWSLTGYNNITISNTTLIVKGGYTRICIRSSRDVNSDTPTGSEFVSFKTRDFSTDSDPRLEVTYNEPPTIGEYQAPSTIYTGTYVFLNATIDNPNGNTKFTNATLGLSSGIILLWTNSTNAFSEYNDSNNYITVDVSTCIKTTVNDTSLRLSWNVSIADVFYDHYYYPGIDIVSVTTKVFDDAGVYGVGSENISGLTIYLDQDPINYTTTSTNYFWLIHFTYNHSTHKVAIILNSPYPAQFIETPLGTTSVFSAIALAILATTLVVWIRRTRRQHQNRSAVFNPCPNNAESKHDTKILIYG